MFQTIYETLFMNAIGPYYMIKESVFNTHKALEKFDPNPQKIVVITGGSRGLGLSVIKHFIKLEYFVILGCRKIEEAKKKGLKNWKMILQNILFFLWIFRGSYATSKAAQVLFTKYLQSKIDGSPKYKGNISVFAVHPGMIFTDLYVNTPSLLFKPISGILMKTPEQGAESILHGALSSELDNQGDITFSLNEVLETGAPCSSLGEITFTLIENPFDISLTF
ncbi:unnamed protein product [Lepeophtheirus salmonis]|uniref:(salmon louse) hypothetical protein n=1 Tax=Lepeophtheirus salmonis TaxID=72036 RepID=A0A7R8H3W7_LEPSM|nr:unnamed protein product [Lepeophtheirus salmonis]CAF2848737.1 unnamed protein product [Lepeophtheirus salmonis]